MVSVRRDGSSNGLEHCLRLEDRPKASKIIDTNVGAPGTVRLAREIV